MSNTYAPPPGTAAVAVPVAGGKVAPESRRRSLLILGAIVVLALAVGAWWFLSQGESDVPNDPVSVPPASAPAAAVPPAADPAPSPVVLTKRNPFAPLS